jgi:ribonuclease HI
MEEREWIENGGVVVYTDGGCVPNPGVGGWAAVLVFGEQVKEISGGEPDSTNNRMELTAAIRALETLKRPCKVALYTDSKYVQQGITAWMPGWKKKGWKRKTGVIKNVELWRRLDELNGIHAVRWKWVKGHAGVALNERCDELVGMEIEQLRQAGA